MYSDHTPLTPRQQRKIMRNFKAMINSRSLPSEVRFSVGLEMENKHVDALFKMLFTYGPHI